VPSIRPATRLTKGNQKYPKALDADFFQRDSQQDKEDNAGRDRPHEFTDCNNDISHVPAP